MSDTIAAIATGQSLCAIGVIRLSGDEAIAVADRVFRPFKGGAMATRRDRSLVYGEMLDEAGRVLDVCLCTISRGPSSYTGENTAELQCHGSPVVLRAGLEAMFSAGARQALAGEFTKRAFLNGRMDLTQAEAVIDLIDAETVESARNAAGQLGGAIMRSTDSIFDDLKDISAHYHAVIDYPDEDIEDFRLRDYENTLNSAISRLRRLSDSFRRGKVMQKGLPTAIVGRPNAGKSSLLNALLGYERAIVTDIPGTTRDTIEERVNVGGVLLRLIDTAGLRETDDAVERIGVDRSLNALDRAELAIVVVDGVSGMSPEDEAIYERAKSHCDTILVQSKTDLGGESIPGAIAISSVTGEGIDLLEEEIGKLYPAPPDNALGEIITNARQAEAVSRALESVEAARDAMLMAVTPDAVLTETENAMAALGELTGRQVREDITSRIFERFCVGK